MQVTTTTPLFAATLRPDRSLRMAGGWIALVLAGIVGAGAVSVNSLHRQAISALAPRLTVEAVADDGTIEAVSVIDAKAFAVGVQWHPEYWFRTDQPSGAIFRAFGEAVRARLSGAHRLKVSA